jgi:hypothetical protein
MKKAKCVYKIITLIFLIFGCTSQEIIYSPTYTLPKQIIPTNVNVQAKQENMHDIKYTLILYNKLIDNIKVYHPKANINTFANELDEYISIYVEPILSDYDLSKSNETSAEIARLYLVIEIARLYLVITSLYYKINDKKQARKYIKLFQRRYGENKDIFDLTMNSTDIGYSTLGEGMSKLQEKVRLLYSGRRNE